MHKIFKELDIGELVFRMYVHNEPFSSYANIFDSKDYFAYCRRCPSKEYMIVEALNIRNHNVNFYNKTVK